jgi:hypothetical protein
MKRILLALVILALAAPAGAVNFVTNITFSIASSASTANTNLRVSPMQQKTIYRDDNATALQTYVHYANSVANYFLTKNQVVPVGNALCIWVEVDQDTKMYLNSETAYLLLPSGTREAKCFR